MDSIPDIQPILTLMSYLAMTAALLFLMLPNPAALSTPRFNPITTKRARWDRVDLKSAMTQQTPCTGQNYLVIGAGFVGKKIIHALLLRGETHIVAFDMHSNACDMFKGNPHVKFIQGNVTRLDQLTAACKDIDVVFATFAIIRFMDNMDHQAALSYSVNVQGTENVIHACVTTGVKRLIQTSTSNVSVSFESASLDMTEKLPYVNRQQSPNHYGWTKALSEQLVLKADGQNGLRTIAVRPCSAVFGSDDHHMLDPLLKIGRSILPPNGGRGVMDFIPVLNVVWGHLLAEHALLTKPNEVAGEAYCLSNDAPMRLRDFAGMVDTIRPGGLVLIPTPEKLLHLVAHGVDFAVRYGWKLPNELMLLTTCTIKYLELSYAFSSKKASEKLGYRPLFTVEEGIHHGVCEWQEGSYLPKLDVVVG